MHGDLASKIKRDLYDLSCLDNMTETHKELLEMFSLLKIPELNRAFNLGVVSSIVTNHIMDYHRPNNPPPEDLVEGRKFIMKFMQNGFKK